MRISWGWAVGGLLVASSCAHAPPDELVRARTGYQQASAGPAATLAPDELAVARQQLDAAEHAYAVDPGSHEVRDLAYAAERESLAATAAAGAESARRDKAAAEAQIAASTSENRQRA